jgi:hypothetical protein
MTNTNEDAPGSELSSTAPDSPATCKRVWLSGLPPDELEVEALMKRLSRCKCCSEASVLGPVPMAA